MAKSLYIAEKPSVAREFAKALKIKTKHNDGYIDSEKAVITWCVGHLVTMSYPECYDENLKKWSLKTLPFLPQEFKYEVIPNVKKQFQIVSGLLRRNDIDTVYVCTDSGREGEYIYRLVEQMAGVINKKRKRVWIDSQTEDEIIRGIREAKALEEYDHLSESAYLRAIEDYLMGINFSRLLTLKYGQCISSFANTKYTVISVGRVMTCVLGMVVRREREIREFIKTPFYRVCQILDINKKEQHLIEGEWRGVAGSVYYNSPKLYKENGFLQEEDAKELIIHLSNPAPIEAIIEKLEKKKEKKYPPLLYNLAELQNDCARMFKISPDETLRLVQELYEKKLVTYPRTDARVLSTAVAKEIDKNINGLRNINMIREYAEEIINTGAEKSIGKSRYVNDKQITDHYAIIPTGQGLGAMRGLAAAALNVYELVVRRFIAIFYPPAVYQKMILTTKIKNETFFATFKILLSPGYLSIMKYSFADHKPTETKTADSALNSMNQELMGLLNQLKKGTRLPVKELKIKEGETTPPKRYNSGSMILAMENAGQLIEDEELRSHIKGSGIGTSATRAEILKKLMNIKYLSLNKKTQIISPTLLGEMIYDVVYASIRSLLNPELTASWEKGLTYVAEGSISTNEYMMKLENFIRTRTNGVISLRNQSIMQELFRKTAGYYQKSNIKGKHSAEKSRHMQTETKKEEVKKK